MWGIEFTDEIWKDIDCFNIKDRYQVSTYWNIINEQERPISSFLRDGYPSVNLQMNDGSRKMFYIHKISAETFVLNGDPVNKTQIDHLDACRTNNFITNLEHVTQLENIRREHLLHRDNRNVHTLCGEDAPNSKYTNEQVHIICNGIENEVPTSEILERAGIEDTICARSFISKVKNHISWKHISSQYNF